MSDQKLVVVLGATGVQGGSVIKSLLGDPKTKSQFKLRGITRDPSKPNAKALAEQGVECVTGDLNSKDSLKEAFKGAYAVFAVTNYWETEDEELEKQHGRNVADAAKECGVQHLIWSSLLNVTELSGGKYSKVWHFDSKAWVETYIRDLGIPATFFLPGFYMSNIPGGMMRANHDSPKDLIFSLPVPSSTPFPLFDAATDTGKFIKAILTQPEQTLGQRIYGATDYYTGDDMVQQVREVKPNVNSVQYVQISPDEFLAGAKYGGYSPKGAEELLQNLLFMPEFGYYGKADLGPSLALLDEKPTSWKEFVAKVEAWKDL